MDDTYSDNLTTNAEDGEAAVFTMPEAKVTIKADYGMDINAATMTAEQAIYNGSPITPVLTLKIGDTTLTEGTDYTIALPEDMTTAGDKIVTITGKGDYAGRAERTFTIDKAALYILTPPTASAITYGDTLGLSALVDGIAGYSASDDKEAEGSFAWKDSAIKPTVADSGSTAYTVVFTPEDKNYNTVETAITLTINKARNAPGMPGNTISAPYSNKKISDVTLPEGWVWKDADKDKPLEVGVAVKGIAVYDGADKGNYETESTEVTVTRSVCEHNYRSEVTKEPTTTSTGVKTYTCQVCGATRTEEIPKLEGAQTTNPEENLPAGTQSTVTTAQKTITATNTDKGDVKGSTFAKFRLKATGKNKAVKLTWKKVKGADGYIIYGARCGKSLKKIKTIKKASTVSYTHKKLKKAKYYKYVVVAYKKVDGKNYAMATSRSAHAVTNGGKYGNPTRVSVKASKITVKKGGKKSIKASYKLPKNKKSKVHIARFRYESSNTKVATVTSKGVVKGKKKGTAYIYVYAQNGVYKRVKVTVK